MYMYMSTVFYLYVHAVMNNHKHKKTVFEQNINIIVMPREKQPIPNNFRFHCSYLTTHFIYYIT